MNGVRPPRMDAAELAEIAEQIYGRDWQSPLAADIGVAARTVQRWAASAMRPPDLRAELAAICRRRARHLDSVAERLERSLSHTHGDRK